MIKKKIGIVDYGVGNIYSVSKSLDKLGYDAVVSNDYNELLSCDGVILPGVGAFGNALNQLRNRQLDSLVLEFAATGKPILGICVGMQLLLQTSNEFGEHYGLGLIKGQLKKIDFRSCHNFKVPVIGWCEIFYNSNTFLNKRFEKNTSFYFVHSYSAHNVNDQNIGAFYEIGGENIVAIIEKDNVIGVQFHPEKSGDSGLNFLKSIFD